MKKHVLILAMAGVLTACGNGRDSATDADSTVTSTTPPPTADSTNTIGTMMGDTTKVAGDSIR